MTTEPTDDYQAQHSFVGDCAICGDPSTSGVHYAEATELKRLLLWIAKDNSEHDAQDAAQRWAERVFGPDWWTLDPNAVT